MSADKSNRPHASTFRKVAALVLLALFVVSCAAGDARFTDDDPAGFWTGIWHGLISWPALIIGLFNDNVHVYERHNAGAWYDFGFLIALSCVLGGGTHSSRRTRVPPHRDPQT